MQVNAINHYKSDAGFSYSNARNNINRQNMADNVSFSSVGQIGSRLSKSISTAKDLSIFALAITALGMLWKIFPVAA